MKKNGFSVAFCSKELHIELTKKPKRIHTARGSRSEKMDEWVNERQHHECDPLQCHLLGEFLLWILLWEQRLQWTEKKTNYDGENDANCKCPLLISSQFLSWSLTQKRFAHTHKKNTNHIDQIHPKPYNIFHSVGWNAAPERERKKYVPDERTRWWQEY